MVLELGHEHPIFTIQSHREEVFRWIFTRIEQLLADVVQVSNEVGDGSLGRHRPVLERDSIGDNPVPENDRNFATIGSSYFPGCGQI